MSPEEKMLLQYKREWLVIKAQGYGLNISGPKMALATRIARYEYEKHKMDWGKISGLNN